MGFAQKNIAKGIRKNFRYFFTMRSPGHGVVVSEGPRLGGLVVQSPLLKNPKPLGDRFLFSKDFCLIFYFPLCLYLSPIRVESPPPGSPLFGT